MTLDKTTKRLIAARRPFSVVEIKNDPSITNVNGKRSSYNLVGKNGSGIAEFGCDEWAALWFCEAANRYADEIYSRHSTTPHSGKWRNGKDYECEFAYCSECGLPQWTDWSSHREAKENIGDFAENYKYCPECGAKMEGGEYVE